MTFGHAFKKKHFPASDNGFVPVNHGSFGLPPQCVLDKYIEALMDDVASPDTYIRLTQPAQYAAATRAVAQVLNCAPQNVALVANATSGVNTVLRSLPFKKGDKIAYASTTYGACANTVQFLARAVGIVPVAVPLDFPMLAAAVTAKFEHTFRTHDIKLALFDAVVSMPGVRMPFEAVARACAAHGVLSLVDGAHLIGLIPVDLGGAAFRPDFYVLNLHKWLSLPRGCAVLYVAPQHHRAVQTLPISHSYVDPDAPLSPEAEANLLALKFTFVGSDTFATLACIPTAIAFRARECGGEAAIRTYCEALARQAGALAVRRWPGAWLVENREQSLVTAMVSVVVPVEQYSRAFDAADAAQMKRLVDFVSVHLLENYRTFVPFAAHNGKVVMRLSAQVYNELSDYEYAVAAAQKALRAFFARKSSL
ncbi:PLP-dependent transferase [Metschnikowia bicuspidata var. bicuspidata NRRL YB-4993]|uniref:PLP-dependent transferase n=1 Tax=Metschnikowia bicuspidata var. bicuspidata NRRL YB-4993 TaxID=869754 RepID=A0A1A0HA08_9ASCO|nr:PLP-dependent transferase [Metschnikowia bicuspidata var. bicuspidata NRRL YB-4993]OBA20708.1 PLP-dependent transferase [Metschnikowia bicuspidata var. bicuspidata NRRL YB-4993]